MKKEILPDIKNNPPGSIDDYIAQFPDDTQIILNNIRVVVKEAAPQAVEKISYGMPGYYLDGSGLVWFGAYKQHIGFYPKTDGMMESIQELSTYKGTKGSVHFPLNKPIPYELIRRMVKVRVAENLNA